MSVDPKVLKQGGLLRPFSPAALERIAARCEERKYERHEAVFDEGAPAEHLFLLVSGLVAIEIDLGRGRRALVQSVEAGENFGWSALSTAKRKTATARVVEPSTVIAIPGAAIEAEIEADAKAGVEVFRNLLRLVDTRLRDTRLQLLNLLDWPVEKR